MTPSELKSEKDKFKQGLETIISLAAGEKDHKINFLANIAKGVLTNH